MLKKFIGCLIGKAIGNSLGSRIEGFLGFQEITEIGPKYTDDTAMIIGVAESLIECEGFNGEDMAQRFVKNYEKKSLGEVTDRDHLEYSNSLEKAENGTNYSIEKYFLVDRLEMVLR